MAFGPDWLLLSSAIQMTTNQRQQTWDGIRYTTFDAVVIGGGVNGACLYHRLCSLGYSVLLVDQGDFATGTSQASGMMIWGGLLYLRNLDFASVYRFCRARDAMIRDFTDRVGPLPIRFIPMPNVGRSRYFVQSCLQFYWLLGQCQRKFPRFERHFVETGLIRDGAARGALFYEEGSLHNSDSRFVIDWITPYQSSRQVPLNYCSVAAGGYDASEKLWRLELRDTLNGREAETRARWVVNSAGAWVDDVNDRFGIDSPFRHILSKGVYVGFKRPVDHKSTLVFETGYEGDVITLAPWGPVSLLGPTECRVTSTEGAFTPQTEDVRLLLAQAERHLVKLPDSTDIVCLRAGVRALAVPKDFQRDCYTLDISRGHRIVVDHARPYISLYGGKITGCIEVAKDIARQIVRAMPVAESRSITSVTRKPPIEYTSFPSLAQPQPSVKWCMEHEFCYSLDDYLRRRTNISQWIAREGLGHNDEHLPAIRKIAIALAHGNAQNAARDVEHYREKVKKRFDSIVDRL